MRSSLGCCSNIEMIVVYGQKGNRCGLSRMMLTLMIVFWRWWLCVDVVDHVLLQVVDAERINCRCQTITLQPTCAYIVSIERTVLIIQCFTFNAVFMSGEIGFKVLLVHDVIQYKRLRFMVDTYCCTTVLLALAIMIFIIFNVNHRISDLQSESWT